MKNSLRILLDRLIDYAGLFPPAGLTMAEAVREYAEQREGPHNWALGRFVLPATQLDEFHQAAGRAASELPLSVLVSPDDFSKIDRPNVQAVELKALDVSEIEPAAARVPPAMLAFFEIPIERNPGELVRAMAAVGARAKVRTGGVTPDAFPAAAQLVKFMAACHQANVPFKATAGLHHPVCAVRPLTYEPGSPSHEMFGFVNVFVAAGFIRHGMSQKEAVNVLTEHDAAAFDFQDDGLSWRGQRLTGHQLAAARRSFALSFGSCSFREPIQELAELGWV